MSRNRLPAEFEAHEQTIMAWPCRLEIWGDQLRQAHLDYAEIARAIARFEPVTMVANQRDLDAAADLCGSGVRVVSWPIDDSWARDISPITVEADGHRVMVDFAFNAWGGKFEPYADDARFAERFAAHEGMTTRRVAMVLEGGSITTDGAGTVVVTQQCLLHLNRNPGFTVTEIEHVLADAIGARKVVWLPFGLALDDDTDGHVDNVAAFVAPGLVLLQGCSDPKEPDRERMLANRRWIQGSTDARGEQIETAELPVLPFAMVGGRRVPVPYLNLYVCNGAVLVPVSGHPADDDMCALIGSLYAGRDVVPVPGATLAYGGGGPHCITMQVPAAPAM